MHQIAGAVAGELHFEMARIENVFFQQHRIVAECGLGLGLGGVELGDKIVGMVDAAHAAAAAARRRLDQDGKADLRGGLGQGRVILRVAVIAGHGRHAGGFRDAFRLDLRAHLFDSDQRTGR